MKRQLNSLKSAFVIALAIAATSTAGAAWAQHGRGHGYHHHGGARVGVFIGGPVLGFPYYGYPGYGYGYGYGYNSGYGVGYAPYGYYGPATTVIAALAPAPVYVEQGGTASISGVSTGGPASDGYWYYCSNPDGYYPYVKLCASGWQRVPPQPINR